MGKIVRNSLLSIAAGIAISAMSYYVKAAIEPINYIGSMFVLGGMIFLDQQMVKKIFKDGQESRLALVRLPVYILFAVLLILLPLKLVVFEPVMRVLRSFGIAFLVLALWRFFTFTTVEEEKMH